MTDQTLQNRIEEFREKFGIHDRNGKMPSLLNGNERLDIAINFLTETYHLAKEEGLQEGEKKGREAEREEILAALPSGPNAWDVMRIEEIRKLITSRTPHN